MENIKPPPLKKGDTIALATPSSPLFLLKIIKESIGKDLQTLEAILNDL